MPSPAGSFSATPAASAGLVGVAFGVRVAAELRVRCSAARVSGSSDLPATLDTADRTAFFTVEVRLVSMRAGRGGTGPSFGTALADSSRAGLVLVIGVSRSKFATAMPCSCASETPRSVGAPAGPSPTAPSRLSSNPASWSCISLREQTRAPRAGVGRWPFRSPSTIPMVLSGVASSRVKS